MHGSIKVTLGVLSRSWSIFWTSARTSISCAKNGIKRWRRRVCQAAEVRRWRCFSLATSRKCSVSSLRGGGRCAGLSRSLTQRLAGDGRDNVWKPLAEIEEVLVPVAAMESPHWRLPPSRGEHQEAASPFSSQRLRRLGTVSDQERLVGGVVPANRNVSRPGPTTSWLSCRRAI